MFFMGKHRFMVAAGTPKYDGNFQHCIERVRYEANMYKKHKIVSVDIWNRYSRILYLELCEQY